MSNKSKRPPRRPQRPPLLVRSLDEVVATLSGRTTSPTCCAKHQAEYRAIVALVSRDSTGQPCFLCGQPSTLRGVFVPDRPAVYGAAPGKTRLLFYALCGDCSTRPDKDAQVEARALQDVRRGQALAAAPWN